MFILKKTTVTLIHCSNHYFFYPYFAKGVVVHLMIVGEGEVVHVPQAPEEGMVQVHLGEEVVEDHHADVEGVQDLKIKVREALLILLKFVSA